jgi:hypothetical protein
LHTAEDPPHAVRNFPAYADELQSLGLTDAARVIREFIEETTA